MEGCFCFDAHGVWCSVARRLLDGFSRFKIMPHFVYVHLIQCTYIKNRIIMNFFVIMSDVNSLVTSKFFR